VLMGINGFFFSIVVASGIKCSVLRSAIVDDNDEELGWKGQSVFLIIDSQQCVT
jgi:hypothetical protein